MATAGTYVNMVFKDSADMNKTIRVNHVDPEDADNTNVNALMDAIVTNKTLWVDEPESKVSAQVVTTQVSDIIIM